MKISLTLIFIVALQFLINCNSDQKTKRIFWVNVSKNENKKPNELPYRYDFFNRDGVKMRDSILFISGLGYKVNKYENGRLISSIARYSPNISETIDNEYDGSGNLVKSIVRTDQDTVSFFYKNKIGDNKRLTEIKVYQDGDTIPKALYQRLYHDSLLYGEKTFKRSDATWRVVKEVINKYDSDNRLVLSITRDRQQNFVDSMVINYNELTTLNFRRSRNGLNELISRKKILDKDSTEVEIFDARKGSTTLIKRRTIEYW